MPNTFPKWQSKLEGESLDTDLALLQACADVLGKITVQINRDVFSRACPSRHSFNCGKMKTPFFTEALVIEGASGSPVKLIAPKSMSCRPGKWPGHC